MASTKFFVGQSPKKKTFGCFGGPWPTKTPSNFTLIGAALAWVESYLLPLASIEHPGEYLWLFYAG
jgi:hypothetical protein